MSVKGDIFLGVPGSEIKITPYGRKLTIAAQESSNIQRTADGTLKKDVLYVKHKITLRYTKISGDDLDVIEGVYNDAITNNQTLRIKIFTADGVSDRYFVVMKPTTKTREVLLSDGVWGGVSFVLDEV